MSMVSKRLERDATALSSAEKGRIRLEHVFCIAMPRLRGLIAARLGSLSIADVYDVSQETCLAFVRREALGDLECFNGRRIAEIGDHEFDHCIEDCCAYLFRIAKHKCNEFYRRSNSQSLAVSRWIGNAQRCTIDPMVDLIRQEQVSRLRQAVSHLPKPFRRVVMLYFYHRRTEEEIGATLGMSARNVRRYLRKSMDKLRAELLREPAKEVEGNGHRGQ